MTKQQHTGTRAAAVLVLALVLVAAGCTTAPTVGRIIDGDTLETTTGERVRLVGVDAPEIGECGYDAATAALEDLAPPGAVVALESDGPQPDHDQYGRRLAYVIVNGADIGLELVRSGVVGLGYRFDREPAYSDAAEHARTHRLGLHSAC